MIKMVKYDKIVKIKGTGAECSQSRTIKKSKKVGVQNEVGTIQKQKWGEQGYESVPPYYMSIDFLNSSKT